MLHIAPAGAVAAQVPMFHVSSSPTMYLRTWKMNN